jgi:hypothetical protein
MTEKTQGRRRKRTRLWLVLAGLAAMLAVVTVPPLVSMARYKARITELMSNSLGRPVRLSSVELRLFPQPGFLLTDLTVAEDPAYGMEPILHANTVKASIRLLSLWRGRLEIGSISVDEASLNLVRNPEGKWNLDSLFRTAAAKAQPDGTPASAPGAGKRAVALPSLEATNSRINVKNATEKLPYSLLNTDLSFWQQEPGDWRIRLRGQPSRTDLSQVDMADAGVVRVEASVRQSPGLRQMPMRVDVAWRDAQLGELARLAVGSDPGWRGDLTGELHLEGTPDAAEITTRLRAIGVHRAEFAPAAPLDFDARCGFLYHFTGHAIERLSCDSPLGNGHIRLAGEVASGGRVPRFSVELDKIPVAAGLDALRTVRSGFGAGLEAKGEISGKIAYAERAPEVEAKPAAREGKATAKARAGKERPAVEGPLTGSFTVEGFELRGDGLSAPITAGKLVLTPVNEAQEAPQGEAEVSALAATVTIQAGTATPLTVNAWLRLTGYSLGIHGQASLARGRELAHMAGMADAPALDALAGEPVAVDVRADGPWMLVESASAVGRSQARIDRLSGTVTLRNANWKADYLANPVLISQATLHLEDGQSRWEPVVFSYGPVKGTGSLTVPAPCTAAQPCPGKAAPSFEVHFSELDAGALQAAILGAHEPGTLLSTLIARFSPSAPTPAWPELAGTVKAETLILGPVTLHDASATVRILATGAEIADLDAAVLGGRVHGAGSLHSAGRGQERPGYTFEGSFEKLSPAAVGQLVGQRWSGGMFNAGGKIDLTGFTGEDLAASAKGTMHFDWQHGAMAGGAVPAALARFDRWSGDAEIGGGSAAVKESAAERGGRKQAVAGSVTLEAAVPGSGARVSFEAAKAEAGKP